MCSRCFLLETSGRERESVCAACAVEKDWMTMDEEELSSIRRVCVCVSAAQSSKRQKDESRAREEGTEESEQALE